MNTTNPNDDLFADFFQVGNYSNLSGNNNNNNNNKMQQLVVNGKKEKIKLERQLKGGREDKEPKRLEKNQEVVQNSKKRNNVKKFVGLAVVIGLIYLVTRK